MCVCAFVHVWVLCVCMVLIQISEFTLGYTFPLSWLIGLILKSCGNTNHCKVNVVLLICPHVRYTFVHMYILSFVHEYKLVLLLNVNFMVKKRYMCCVTR